MTLIDYTKASVICVPRPCYVSYIYIYSCTAEEARKAAKETKCREKKRMVISGSGDDKLAEEES